MRRYLVPASCFVLASFVLGLPALDYSEARYDAKNSPISWFAFITNS